VIDENFSTHPPHFFLTPPQKSSFILEFTNEKLRYIEVDTSCHFLPNKTFVNREDLLKWARHEAAKLRFAIVILRSDNDSDRRKLFLVLGYEKGGEYKPTNKKLKFEELRTRKYGCLFRLGGYFHATRG
jgi:hypothetical protein